MKPLRDKVDGVVVRVAANYADDYRKAFVASFPVNDIIDSFLRSFPLGFTATRQQARDWAEQHVVIDQTQTDKVIDQIFAAGWTLGIDYATAAVGEQIKTDIAKAVSPSEVLASLRIDWAKWKAGFPAAANLVRPPSGLQDLLDRKTLRIGNGSRSVTDRIGTILADALDKGSADTRLARSLMASGLNDYANDPQRALTVANTEMNRAVSAATVDRFNELGVTMHEWFAIEGCDECEMNADQGPIPVGSMFDSGDTEPPAHPNCRCGLLPFISSQNDSVRGIYEMRNEQALSLADGILERVAPTEPAFTETMVELAETVGGEMHGLDNRVKGRASLARKILADANEKYLGNYFEAAKNVSDTVRYTIVTDSAGYANAAQRAIDILRSQGWNARVKNAWAGRVDYKGINVALTSPSGQLIELQFHTPESIATKEPAHKLYERWRLLHPDTVTAKSLFDQIAAVWAKVSAPNNATLVKKA
jgi:hypothetical protein